MTRSPTSDPVWNISIEPREPLTGNSESKPTDLLTPPRALAAVLGCWALLAVIFGALDLDISKAIVNQQSTLGVFIQFWGEVPGHYIIAWSVAVLAGDRMAPGPGRLLVAWPVYLVSLSALSFLFLDHGLFPVFVGVGGLVFAAFTLATYPDTQWEHLEPLAFSVLVLAVVCPLLFVQITKRLCGRIRFRDLSPDFHEYTTWYDPPGPQMGDNSFPSGHTAMGWMLIPVLVHGPATRTRAGFIIRRGLVIGWGFLVGGARVLVGAHYASDVLFSTGVSFVYVTVLWWRTGNWKGKGPGKA